MQRGVLSTIVFVRVYIYVCVRIFFFKL